MGPEEILPEVQNPFGVHNPMLALFTMTVILIQVCNFVLGVVLSSCLMVRLWRALKRNLYRNLPPGPIGLPLFGYWLYFHDRLSHHQLAKMKEEYGAIFSFTCTGQLYINLGTIKLVREAHMTKSDHFSGRTTEFTLLNYILEGGIPFSNGEKWKTLRNFFLTLFRDHGMVSIRDSMSGPLYDSINSVVDHLKASNGEPVNITELLSLRCTTILRQALFGEHGVTDEEILNINRQYGNVSAALTFKNLLLTGMRSKYLIFPFRAEIRTALKCKKEGSKLFHQMVQEHLQTYDEDNPRDVIDKFFKERERRQRNGDATATYFTNQALVSSLMQFVGEGAINVAAFVTLFLKEITARPEEQEKIYKEIMEVVGPNRQPSIADKSKLSYTNAFVMEALRMSEFVTYFPSLVCTRETTLGEYRIPKGAITVTNMWTAHHDPEEYEEPEKFNPSRFIRNGTKQKAELPITFGVGKRKCMGEGFVMTQAFLFLVTIVKNFRLTAVDDNAGFTELFVNRAFLTYAHPRDEK